MSEEPIINGIDVSVYFIEVVDEGGSTINYKILPNIERLLVERIFEQNQQLKHLQEENKKLKNKNNDLIEVIASGNIDIAILQKENEELKANKDKYYLLTLDYETKISYLIQALEEIRKEANRLLYELNPIYGYNNSNYFELLAKYVLAKTKEVLNDRN